MVGGGKILKLEAVSVELEKLPRTKPNTHQGVDLREGKLYWTIIPKDIFGTKDILGITSGRCVLKITLSSYIRIGHMTCASCPHHQISEQLLLQYFYEGLNNMDRSIIDAASGGALGDMTPFEARCLIEKMASNSQQFNARSGDAIVVRGVHDVGTNAARQDKLETKIDSLTTLITQLAINQQKSSMARVCGICTSSDHYSDMCPSLLEPRTGDHPEAYAANIYNNKAPHQQQHYDPPSSSTYNPGWRNQTPFQNNNIIICAPPIQQQRHQMINTPAPTEPSLEELVRQMTMQNMQFQQETRASIQRQESSIQNLTTQMGQMATSLNTLQSQNSDKLPSQTVLNPRNVSAITLRSGTQTEVPTPRTDFVLQKEHDASKRNKSVLVENENTTRETHANQPSSSVAQQPFSIPLPFPPKIIPTKKMGNMEELDKDLLDTFRKVEVNIPLLDAIKQIPRYAKFLKELCTHKRKLKGNERINMGRNFLNIDIDIDVPCTSLYTCHACTDSELCDSCIDEFLNIVVDSPVTHSHCTNTIDVGIRQQSDLFVQAPDWTPPFDLECDIAVYALGTVLAKHIWHQGHFGHYKRKMCAKVKIICSLHTHFQLEPFLLATRILFRQDLTLSLRSQRLPILLLNALTRYSAKTISD
ncbi:hypothetical protein Lal_00022728 [Lupinus albus]|nr:hypothetical protein Lal_00022728 [Lupinus albus]